MLLKSLSEHALYTIYTFAVLLLLYFAPHAAQGQILNIERSRVDPDSAGYFTGTGGLSFSMFNRNAGKDNPNNYLQLTFNGDLAYISEKHSYLLLNYYNYLLVNYDSEELRNTVASTGYSHFRVNFMRKKRLSYELFAQTQADKARGLEFRTLAGGGVRYRVLRSQNSSLYVGTGFMHEHEEWENPELEQRLIAANLLKSTNYVSGKVKLNEQVSTEGIVYYQFGYDDAISRLRNRVSGDVTLQVRLTNKFSFKTNFSCVYEDEPIVPVTRFVYAISNGIQVQF
ncbi:DUF481 domain-containing protein [Pontibacter flavimaris]|uniref:DUF481 domain-containing protein n=1 Tax=Pontibacter flavimaris TaxID=1797110 RepID=A0A1Q5PGT3_9BACT|nr:DUF481 domain-containing protein [Pontibacter flavimaris]OKL41430.1 hypothetical protein A3841_10250 [Pontibacter flavimaris]